MADSKPPTRTLSFHCSECQGHRPHYPRISSTVGPKGQRVRILACSGCEKERDIGDGDRPGINCPNPKCRDIRFRLVYVRQRYTGTVRVKACRGCGRRIQTCERITSNSV